MECERLVSRSLPVDADYIIEPEIPIFVIWLQQCFAVCVYEGVYITGVEALQPDDGEIPAWWVMETIADNLIALNNSDSR